MHDAINEEWRDIPGFEGLYQASIFGAIRSVDRVVIRKDGRSMPKQGRLLRANAASGYMTVTLWRNGAPFWASVHRLVAEAFLEGDGEVVRHLDGDAMNNSMSNLSWGSYKDNEDDKERHGRRPRGETSGPSKLREVDVVEIRRMRRSGVLVKTIAAKFCVRRQTIGDIIRGRTWRHVCP